jgi:hypothetical protein
MAKWTMSSPLTIISPTCPMLTQRASTLVAIAQVAPWRCSLRSSATRSVLLAPSNEVIARKILNDLASHRQFEMTEADLQIRPRS